MAMLLVNPLSPGGKTGGKEPYLPAMQSRHVSATEAPTVVEYLPAAQLVHAAEPVTLLYVPAAHAEHVPPLGPEYPVLQTQLCTLVLAVGEFVYAGHG